MAQLPFCLSLGPCLILVRTKCTWASLVHRGSALDSSLSVYTEVHFGSPGHPKSLRSAGSEFVLGNRLSTRLGLRREEDTFSSGQKTSGGYILLPVTAGDTS